MAYNSPLRHVNSDNTRGKRLYINNGTLMADGRPLTRLILIPIRWKANMPTWNHLVLMDYIVHGLGENFLPCLPKPLIAIQKTHLGRDQLFVPVKDPKRQWQWIVVRTWWLGGKNP